MIGAIVAMNSEAEILLGQTEVFRSLTVSGKEVYVGRAFGKDVTVVVCGVGKVNAALGAQLAVSKFDAEKLFNFGVAGGLNKRTALAGVYQIEKAVQFYIDHLTAADDRSMLPNAMLSSMKSIVAESDNRLSRLLFKLAVELAVTMNVVAANSDIDDVSLERLKGECVKEVKRLNGNFTFRDANDWQKG